MGSCRSTERERECLHARIEKLDLEQSIGDGFRLPDQLVQALFGDRAVALIVDIDAMGGTWRLSIDEHTKPHGGAWGCRSHDEIEIAGVKAVGNPAAALV